MTKKVYKNSLRSREMIRHAVFLSLQKKSDPEKITITEVVQLAGINRGTFYNHYNSINDVIGDIENTLVDSFSNAIDFVERTGKDAIETISSLFDTVNEFMRKDEPTIKMLCKLLPGYIFADTKEKLRVAASTFIAESLDGDRKEEIKTKIKLDLAILSNGMAGTYLDYFLEKIDSTLDQIKDEAISLYTLMLKTRIVD